MPYALRYDMPPAGQDDHQQQTHTAPSTQQPNHRETIYVTMSTKDPERHIRWPNVGNAVMACVAIAMLLTLVVSPDVYTTKTLTVPVILLPMRTITVTVPIQATGMKTYPAQAASGTLTITNGGSLTQYIQAGFLLTSSSGVEVATDEGVTVPAGNGEHYGVATVGAHAVVAGSSGNIPAYSVDQTYGTDIFMKNLTAFQGGKDAYSVQYATDQDIQAALTSAKVQVESKQPLVLLLKPCTETTSQQADYVSATLACQPITYHAPAGIHVLGVRVEGTHVVLTYRTLFDAGT